MDCVKQCSTKKPLSDDDCCQAFDTCQNIITTNTDHLSFTLYQNFLGFLSHCGNSQLENGTIS